MIYSNFSFRITMIVSFFKEIYCFNAKLGWRIFLHRVITSRITSFASIISDLRIIFL
jgi:hypothetical protein